MADNFDSNVARRKPNIAAKRPIHPWDIPNTPPVISREESTAPETLVESASVSIPEIIPQTSFSTPVYDAPPSEDSSAPASLAEKAAPSESATVPEPRPAAVRGIDTAHTRSSSRTQNLSDSINIHSNFCKLDNDISDHLMRRLSASAQSVFLRLYRQSYGWNRNWAAESLPKLCEYCNLSLQTVRKAIKELETVGCIRKEFSDYHKATVYRIFLPSEIGIGKNPISNNGMSNAAGLFSDSLSSPRPSDSSQIVDVSAVMGQDSDTFESQQDACHFPSSQDTVSWGQNIDIQSLYFPGTSVCGILESGVPLPKNMSIYTTHIHLAGAVSVIDEFYDSIGFSVVSRALYRKSLLDYFDLLKSGFSVDDIRYAVRWTFKNSRSRPESFTLIKHTMHLAMNDFIRELKTVSGETETAREKQEAVQRTLEWRARDTGPGVRPDDMKRWLEVVEHLRDALNEHSFSAFIEPLRLESVEEGRIVVSAPPDSAGWVSDHYAERIRESYRERSGMNVEVVVK